MTETNLAQNPAAQFIRYMIVALASFTGQYLAFGLMMSMLDLYPTLASALGYLVGSVINYVLNHIYSFRSQHRHGSTILRFYGAVAFGFCINTSCMFGLSELLAFGIWPSQVIASVVTVTLNFWVMKWLVFDRTA